MKLKIAITFAIVAAFSTINVGQALAYSGSCTVTSGPKVPNLIIHALGDDWYDNTPGDTTLTVSCTNGTTHITAVSVLSQLFIGGTSLYDNGYGYQTVDAADTHANSFTVTSLNPPSSPYDFHGNALCDGIQHWYGQRWFYKVYWSDGTSTDILHSVDSGGVYIACT
jgi:hypothetical protein